MSGKEKGVATRVQEVVQEIAPKAIYVHCYGHLLNLALQDTLQENTVIRNALGVVQSIHNFNTPKRENVLYSVHMPDIDPTPYSPYIKLKSLSETRWSCRWEAVKAVEQQPERILLALIELSKEKDAKTSVDAKSLVKAMLEFQFILGLHTLKVIFSNTNALARYLQGHDVDMMTAKITYDATLETLKKCREEDMFSLIWEKARKNAINMKEIEPYIEELETKKRQKKPSKRLQALSGETPEEPISFTDHQRARIAYYDALDRVLTEMR
ncbi:zinc finger MYM-type protein 1-like [Macrobrachium rosenbergii]|uniref:zinc finger MYM-type protein 1-like n=1 Tax=Macrobrachium rosenbergii TaxID=79674 RepID=UPI0034D75572